MKKLCIYHGNCVDGFGAAWAVRHALGDDVEFHPGIYGEPAPDCTGREIIMVDFSYKRDVLIEIAEVAKLILILDHHKSAQAELVDLPDNVNAIFDMQRSGAMIAWQHFNEDEPPPFLIEYIQDRDLWKFDLEGTREVQAALFSYPYDFKVWDELMQMDTHRLYTEGKAIERKHFKDIKELIKVGATRDTIAGFDVPVLNAPYFYSSDVGHILGDNEPFAACYHDTPKGRVYSLRSAKEGEDVSVIAAHFGGGGHQHAAGFTIALDQLLTLRLPMIKGANHV